jgi:hypothetical protein
LQHLAYLLERRQVLVGQPVIDGRQAVRLAQLDDVRVDEAQDFEPCVRIGALPRASVAGTRFG